MKAEKYIEICSDFGVLTVCETLEAVDMAREEVKDKAIEAFIQIIKEEFEYIDFPSGLVEEFKSKLEKEQ